MAGAYVNPIIPSGSSVSFSASSPVSLSNIQNTFNGQGAEAADKALRRAFLGSGRAREIFPAENVSSLYGKGLMQAFIVTFPKASEKLKEAFVDLLLQILDVKNTNENRDALIAVLAAIMVACFGSSWK